MSKVSLASSNGVKGGFNNDWIEEIQHINTLYLSWGRKAGDYI
jgi:hypothetical protein